MREVQLASEETGIGLSITDEEVELAENTPVIGDMNDYDQTPSTDIQTAPTA